MSNIICVTNRKLCKGNFIERIKEILDAGVQAVILREKDLSQEEYKKLTEQILPFAHKKGVPCVIHNFYDVAEELHVQAAHFPLPVLRTLKAEERKRFQEIGTSCHSLNDALEAEKLGCTYLVAGHVFATDCKKGIPPRGLPFLEGICNAVSVPVYAIGGIASCNIAEVIKAGAAGGCVMSGLMQCENVKEYLKEFEHELS